MVLCRLLALFLAACIAYCKNGSDDDFENALAAELSDIGSNLVTAQQAIWEGSLSNETQTVADPFDLSWGIRSLWKGGNVSETISRWKHLGPHSLDGYIELLIERQARLNEPLPRASYGYVTRSHIIPGKLRYVENSGICETTTGVYQASGYADLSENEHMWFWFFEARENPDTAPTAIWINGGPGSSSMSAVLDINGPCLINEDGNDVRFNPKSWNQKVNMLYIDQPIGVGFSYGNLNVDTTAQAAVEFWKMLQIFFSDSKFAKYQRRDLGLWTVSYGGHWGPSFAAYILKQNEKIQNGELEGKILYLKSLGIANGLTDAVHQYEGYMNYANNNPYRDLAGDHELETAKEIFSRGAIPRNVALYICSNIPESCRILGLRPEHPDQGYSREEINSALTMTPDDIKALLKEVERSGCESRIMYCQIANLLKSIPRRQNPFYALCATAQTFCNDYYWGPLSEIKGNPYWIIDEVHGHQLPNITPFLEKPEVLSKIGAQSKFIVASLDVYENFAKTGDWMYSFTEDLEYVIDANVATIIFNGDADYVVNFRGIEDLIDNLNIKWQKKLDKISQKEYTVNGEVGGLYKTSGTFSYLRVFGAGHSPPKYGWKDLAPGQVSLQMFNQVVFEGKIYST